MPFLTTALAVGAIASGVGGAAASMYGAHEQSQAAKSAAQLQYEESQNALDFQKQEYSENVARQAPWLKAGTGAVNELSALTSTPGEGLLAPWSTPFNAPDALTERNDPGYKARLDLGQQALENSAAARGGVLAGGTAKDLTNYSQTFASNEYGNVFNRAIEQYQQAYNIFQNNQTNTYNRLAGVAGLGQTTAANLGREGQSAATNVGNIDMTTGQIIGSDLQNAAYQTASGYAGAVNSLGAIPGQIGGILALQKMLDQQGAATVA